jgi:hypothetical protein
MAKDVITRFKLETTGFDSKLKQAAKGMADLGKSATQAGKNFNDFTKDNVAAARALGSMETSTTNAKDKVKELVGAFNEAAKAYNSLTKEQQQSDWAKAMAGSLTQLQQRIQATKQEMQGLGDAVGGGGIFSGDKLSGMLQVFGGNLMTKAAGYAMEFASGIGECVKQGIELAKQGEGIRIAFERLGRGDILQGLRDATHGTVTDIELMKAAVKFNDFKLPLEELGTMLAFAQQKAKDTGQSVDYMVDSIVTGLGRKSLMILDNLGLSAAEIKEKMKETGDMTSAVGAIIREQMSKAGEYIETAADRATQADVELKNAMEELGRTFQPLTDAGTSMWKSLKIGALELLNDAVKPLIENLTYAGRLKAQLDKMNGGGNGRPSEVQKQLGFLQKTSPGNRQARYEKQLGIYAQAEEQEWRRVNAQRNQLNAAKAAIAKTTPSGTLADASESQKEYLKGLEQSLNISIAKAKEWGNITKQYKEGAKAILNPVKETVDDTIKGVDELKKKLIDLQAERKKVAAGSDEAKRLDAEIRQVKADIKLQDPNAFKTTTTHTLTKPEQADAKFDQAQKDYNQALEQAAMEVKAGTITSAEGKKKELQATETLWKAIGDAREIYDSPKLQEEQKKVEAAYTDLAAEVRKASQQMATGISGLTPEMLASGQADIKKQMQTVELGSEEYNQLSQRLIDYNAVSNLMQEAVKSGLEVDDNVKEYFVEALTGPIGENIPQALYDSLVESLNEFREYAGENPIELDTNTGNIKESKTKDGSNDLEKLQKSMGTLSQGISGLSGIASGLSAMGLKLDSGIGQAINAMQGVMQIINGVISIIQMVNAFKTSSEVPAQQMNTAAIWSNTIAIDSLIGALATNSAMNLIPFAGGGMIPHAADGYVVPGTHFSGDVTPILANAGEIVLNHSQSAQLAEELEGDRGEAIGGMPYVTGETIYLGLNNYLKANGYGEIVTTRR